MSSIFVAIAARPTDLVSIILRAPVTADACKPGAASSAAPLQFSKEGVVMVVGISLFTMLLMVLMAPATLGWFAGSSAVAGVAVAAWLNRRAGLQQLFVKAEEPPPVTKLRLGMRLSELDLWKVRMAAAFVFGILIGYLLANLIFIQLHTEALARAATLT